MSLFYRKQNLPSLYGDHVTALFGSSYWTRRKTPFRWGHCVFMCMEQETRCARKFSTGSSFTLQSRNENRKNPCRIFSLTVTCPVSCGFVWLCVVGVLLYVHRNRRFIRDWSPGRPPRLWHSYWAVITLCMYSALFNLVDYRCLSLQLCASDSLYV